METLESKYSAFEKEILTEAETQVKAILEAAQHEIDDKKATLEKSLQERCDKNMAEAKKKMQQYKNAAVSRAKIEKNKILLQKREELINRLLDEVSKELTKFTTTDQYEKSLKDSLIKSLATISESSIELFLVAKDHALFNKWSAEIAKTYSGEIVLKELPSESKGGFAIRNQAKALYIDEALSHRLIEARTEVAHALIRKL